MPPPRARHEALTEETLGLFLDAFYAKVRRDPVIGPVFAARIAADDWPRHLATIHDFWSSVLLKTGLYKGNPFGKHMAIDGLGVAHFERWLGLFSETAAEAFTPEIAGVLSERANRIGDSLKAGLFFRPEVLRSEH